MVKILQRLEKMLGLNRSNVVQEEESLVRKMKLLRDTDLKRLYLDYAINCAKHVLPIYEKRFPKDDRPRKAIEAADRFLNDMSFKNLDDADYAASLAARSVSESYEYYSASAASFAAGSAEYAARSAAFAVWCYGRFSLIDDRLFVENVRYSATLSAEKAARSADWSPGWSREWQIFPTKEEKWQKELLENLVQKYSASPHNPPV